MNRLIFIDMKYNVQIYLHRLSLWSFMIWSFFFSLC